MNPLHYPDRSCAVEAENSVSLARSESRTIGRAFDGIARCVAGDLAWGSRDTPEDRPSGSCAHIPVRTRSRKPHARSPATQRQAGARLGQSDGDRMGQLEVWWAQVIEVLRDTIQAIVTYVPVVLTAIAVLIIGWLLARVLRGLVRRAIESMDWLFARLSSRSVERAQALTRVTTRATSRAISSVVYWSVLLIFAANALRILGGTVLERWTDDLIAYLPSAI